MIRDAFGPGTYKVMLYGEHPSSGTFGIMTRTEITLAENRSTQNKQAQSGGVDSGLSAVLAQLARGQETMLAALMEVKQAPAADPMAAMKDTFSMMALMREAMGINNQPQQKSSIAEIMEAVREMRVVAKELSPEGADAEPTLLGLAPQVLELIKTGMEKQNAATETAQVVRPVQVPQSLQNASTPTPDTTNTPTQPTEEDMRLSAIAHLYKLLDDLVAMAAANAPPDAGGELIYEHIPDEILEVMKTPEWFTSLCALRGTVQPHKEWFTKARDAALLIFSEEAAQDAADSTGDTDAKPPAP